MTDLQLFVAHAVKLALAALLVGLFRRGRAGLCWSFVAYAVAILVGNCLVSFWPSRFYNPAFWVLKQGAYDILKMAIAVELSWRVFARFPGAMSRARLVLLAVLAASTLGLAVFMPTSSYLTLWEWQPGVATATVWLLTATALLVVWYQIPLHAWQRAIMLGLAPYLLVFMIVLDLLARRGWPIQAEVGIVDSLAYLALLVFWAWSAWRPLEIAPDRAAGSAP